MDAVTVPLSDILPVPCSHRSVKTKAVVEIFPLFFLLKELQMGAQRAGEATCCGEFHVNYMFIAEESAGGTRHFLY